MRTGGAEILVVSNQSGKEQYVPLAAPIVIEVNVAAKTIVIDPPEGLLEL
jgi:ribosomal 30S subunit maturation factor RimM